MAEIAELWFETELHVGNEVMQLLLFASNQATSITCEILVAVSVLQVVTICYVLLPISKIFKTLNDL